MIVVANLAIKAQERVVSNKGGARQLRRNGQVPAVLYGAGMAPTALQVGAKEVERLVAEGGVGRLIDLETAGGVKPVILKEVQRDHLKGSVLHVDFHAVALNKKVHTVVPITVVGDDPRATDRVVVHGAREITVECLPTSIPEHIEINVENLEVGDSIVAGQVALPAGVALVTDPNTLLVHIVAPRAAVEAEETAETAEAADEAKAEKENE